MKVNAAEGEVVGQFEVNIECMVDPRRRSRAVNMKLTHYRLLPQFLSQRSLLPSPCGGVVEKATRDVAAEHVFQGQGVGAELDLIITPLASTALFIFDRIDLA
jgi:hypothetical protein